MIRRMRTTVVLMAGGLALVGGLAACSTDPISTDPTARSTVTATTTATATATTTATATATATAGSGDTGDGGDGGGTGTVSGLCPADALQGTLVSDGGGAAGSVDLAVVLQYTGTGSCTLQGWPGVSFVGGGNGTQIGAPAILDRSSAHPTVTVTPTQPARFALRVTRAENVPASECQPQAADGFRVYPPGSKTSTFVTASGYTACAADNEQLLSVQAVTQG